ncbi:hypothetical protein PybrP1_011696 [[Pythium] brassicae (nom. inval.)]|nr:hypothetical protein PybrP1_011696 [[Pythium] brassicae (nom. inval.)]
MSGSQQQQLPAAAAKQARLLRQASVLHELQESQEKDSLVSRYARIMAELAALCRDRSNVITADSLAFFASGARAEPVRLEREPERAGDAAKGGKQQDEQLSADAARRQRVEELTRFFMEAKSDIDFALGAGREFRDAKDRDGAAAAAAESERDDEREAETGDNDDDDKGDKGDDADPAKLRARMHGRLLREPVDARVYTPLLSQIREQDPALYGAVLCHPLVTGVDPKKDKRKKKKRKERKEKSSSSSSGGGGGSGSSQHAALGASAPSMLVPDFAAEPLGGDDMALNTSRLVAKAIADGSIQALVLATKLVLSAVTASTASTDPTSLVFPLASHLRVLRGEKAPEYPPKPSVAGSTLAVSNEPTTPPKSDRAASHDTATSDDAGASAAGGGATPSALMDLDAASANSLAKLRARLSRFGDDDEDDDDDDEEEDDEDARGDDSGSIGEEGVDEDALMARAIALSLSPELSLREQSEETSPISIGDAAMAGDEDVVVAAKPRPAPFSPEEMLGLGPFELPDGASLYVDGVTVAMALVTQTSKLCLEFLESCRKGVLPSGSAVQPHPLTFMLVNSVLADLSASSIATAAAQPPQTGGSFGAAKWRLFTACSLLSLFRVLEAHFFHVEVAGTAPASVGLGHIPKPPGTKKTEETPDDAKPARSGNPLLASLRALVTRHMESDAASTGDAVSDVVGSVVFVPPEKCATADVERVASFYAARVREQAAAAWVRAIAHFYPSQQERHHVLTAKLAECQRLVANGGGGAATARLEWKFIQLDLLCARLALPDMAQLFVPPCTDVVEHGHDSPFAGTSGSGSQRRDDESAQPIDDGVLQNAASKTGKIRAKWSPGIIRASLEAGSLSSRCLLDYLTEHAPPGLLESTGVSTVVISDDARHLDLLASAYEQMWDLGRKLEREALDSVNQLPHLIDLLRESVLSDAWTSVLSFPESLELVHAPLLPLLESASRPPGLNARVLLLRALQDLMVQRLGGSRGDEPPALEFDPSRCAETMTLSDGNQTAKQYTAKQWGMVMATTGCPPNTGIHEWAVRLDRCEKGHIFLGVCTRDASVATYVGGDRQGWGLIGTRALWHNRSKVRGDYGDGFSTGSVVRVRLNTDSGALSFGVDDSDWGIAFDGLTQHGTLYPAIGLYQRDDQVTILPVASSDDFPYAAAGAGDMKGAKRMAIPAVVKPFLHHCGALLEATCAFLQSPQLSEALRPSPTTAQASRNEHPAALAVAKHPAVFPLVLPLLSAIGLIKNYHGLGSLLAVHFIPWCIKSMKCLENVNQAIRHLEASSSSSSSSSSNSNQLALTVAGEWELKSMAAGSIPAQQYHLTLTQGQDGAVFGRSSGSFTTVTLTGMVRGTKVSFLESWRQGGMCLVEGRLRADGKVFNGSYEDAKSHTSGSIVGTKLKDEEDAAAADTASGAHTATWNDLKILEMVAANLLGYFSHALMNVAKDDLLLESLYASLGVDEEIVDDGSAGVAADDPDEHQKKTRSENSLEGSSDDYDEWMTSSLLSGGLPPALVQAHLKSMLEGLSDLTGFNRHTSASSQPILAEACSAWLAFVSPKSLSAELPTTGSDSGGAKQSAAFLHDLINNSGEAVVLDQWVSRHVGESPFARLGGEPMKVARRTICAAMIWHSGVLGTIRRILDAPHENLVASEVRPHENLMHIWRAAQRVIEWAIRAKNAMGSTYPVIAGLVIRKAQFLLEIEPSSKALAAASAVFALSGTSLAAASGGGAPLASTKAVVYECAERIYSEVLMQISRFIEAPIRISSLQAKLLGNSTRAFLRTLGLLSFRSFVGDASSSGGAGRSPLSAEPRDVIQSSYALSSALQWLTPSLSELRGGAGSHGAALKDFGDFSSELSSLGGAGSASLVDSSHFLSGLGGCGKHLKQDLRESFESLYSYLCASLSRATWARDTDLQLVILQAWGIIIQPDDHAFLSRVGIFRVLQTVLDEARGSSDPHALDGASVSPPGTLDERALAAEAKKKVVQATLKVVHLLAAQVAHAGDTADDLVSATDIPNAAAGLSLGAIPLLRKPSGPETLGKSVFHMLYTELKNSLDELRSSARRAESKVEAAASGEPTEAADPSASSADAGTADRVSDAAEYCYQICSLLYSVSGSPVCRSHLSSSRWLHLLLALVDVNAPSIQRRILKLLRRLLPSLDPSAIRVRYDEVESFEMDSDDDDVDTDAQDDDDAGDHAATLIRFFVAIVGSISPPSVAEMLLGRAAGGPHADQAAAFAAFKNTIDGDLAAEVILLLRSLYESEKWAAHLNRAIAGALARIPDSLSGPAEKAIDADVVMEDMSRELPSLDAWKAQSADYLNALSALCVLDGHIEGLRVGGTVKIMPRSGSALQEIAFRGARGVVVAYEPDKAAAEVLLRGSHSGELSASQQTNSSTSGALPTRPVRVPVDDLYPVPEVELPPTVFSDAVLETLLVRKLPYFLSEIKKSLAEIEGYDALGKVGGGDHGDESEEDDDMSNDGFSSSPSGMDVTGSGGVEDSEAESEITSPRQPPLGGSVASPRAQDSEPSDIASELEKESRLFRMLLCQHGLRASAALVKDSHCAATLIRGAGPRGLMDLLSIAISDTPATAGIGDISSLEETWLLLWARWHSIRVAHATPAAPIRVGEPGDSAVGSPAESLASGPMVQQMMEMGFPKEWCEVALARCSHNVEAAINFCFEHSSDMERLLAQYKASQESASSGAGSSAAKAHRRDELDLISPLLEQLSEMGFPVNWCKKALVANRNNVDAALTWILSNGEALEAEDRRDEEAKLRVGADEPSDESAEIADDADERVLTPNPLRCVSGQACIGEHDMMVEGLVGGGFASVGAPDCLVSRGRWYYEATLHSNGCIQIGWADVAFSGSADRGDGVGDGSHSWAYDGWRQQKWHGQSSPWGSKWKQGDVVGCAIDADAGTIIFTLNGKMGSANMGTAFRAIKFARGVYPCASFNRRERLQFNLGGTPFKHSPPPGFEPILHVLAENASGGGVEALPKGFAVIGTREDCLEESLGEENYTSDARFFPRDVHPSMLRGAAGHTRSTGLASGGGSKADAAAEIKAIPDSRVYIELLLVSRSLAILQARRMLLTVLAKWPAAAVGPFSVRAFLSSSSSSGASSPSSISRAEEDATRFIDFLKLIAGLSGHHALSASLTAPIVLPESDVAHLLECGATGRYALGLLSDVTRSALHAALTSVRSDDGDDGGDDDDADPLVRVILTCVGAEVTRASQRQYARVPWEASDAAITGSILQLSADAGQVWSERDVVLSHPNLFLAEWFTSLVNDGLVLFKAELPAPAHDRIRQQLLSAWIASLKSPSLGVKERGATILAGIFQEMLPRRGAASEGVAHHEKRVLEAALDALPLRRLVDLTQERMLKEAANLPVCSKYLQSLMELVAAIALSLDVVGKSTAMLFEANVAAQLAACKRIQADLFPINLRDANEASDIADNASNAGGATHMEVDTSDAEDAPDITLSAIANMVSEDSDVAAAAAAIAVAANSRVTVKRQSRTKQPVEPPPKTEPEFEFVFPDEEIAVDVAMLSDREKQLIDAAKHGIMGEEVRGWRYGHEVGVLADTPTQLWSGSVTQFRLSAQSTEQSIPELTVGCKVIRGPNWKWRDQDGGEGSVGVVEGVSPWSGVDGEGMSVRWPNDSLYTYRWGADGNFDLVHVEVDDADGKIVRQFPTPKTKHDDEGKFGSELHLGVLLYVFDDDGSSCRRPAHSNSDGGDDAPGRISGVMEWPDYGAEVLVVGLRYADGSICIQELQLTRGNPDMGWSLRFGTEKWQPGTKYLLRPANGDGDSASSSSSPPPPVVVDTLRGSYAHSGYRKGKLVSVQGEIVVTTRTLFTMDPHCHFSTLGISDGGLTVTCHSGESRNLALATVGFTTGVHYWEVRVDQAEFGSVFIGVCEKAGPPGSQAALSSRLNRWHGWGFVNFRATYHNSTERIYGDHFNAGDTIGVRLDMEQGKLSFFMDGIKFGEHIVADLGVAFENVKGERGAKTLFPCIGMRKGGDRVTLNEKWISMPGVSPRQVLTDAMDVSRALHAWYAAVAREKTAAAASSGSGSSVALPESLLRESWADWKRWRENRWQRFPVRPRGVLVDFDTSPAACIRVSQAAGLGAPFLAGDRVRMCSKCGRELNQPEEAVILGVYRDLLWYRTETQGNEGADEGRAWGWYLAPAELVELLLIKRDGKDMTLLENSAMDVSAAESSPDMTPFAPRSEPERRALEDFSAFVALATRAHSTASDMQLVERLNTFCAATGTDVTNLRIGSVLVHDEAIGGSGDSAAAAANAFIQDDYFSTPALKPLSGPELRARCSVLRVLNSKILRVLPLISIESADTTAATVIDVASAARDASSSAATPAAPASPSKYLSTSQKLRALRRLVFTSTKRAFWDDVLRATTTSTPLPSDEYEDPREIRVIRINRIQAQASKLSLLAQPGDRLRRSVFGQLYREMRTWNDSFFRRAYCGKGHGGQRRAFKVKFLGEGVNDYGGPYRAVFEQIVDELQMDNVELSKGEQGLLPLLVPCPNRRSGTGSNQDKFLLNPSCGTSATSNGPMALDLHRFLGKVIGTAVRHGLQMGLDLPSLVWRPLSGLDVGRAHLESVDVVTTNNLALVEECDPSAAESVLAPLSFSTPLSDGTEAPLCPNGESVPVTLANRAEYVKLVEKTRLTESAQQLAALREGLASVLPMELAPLFTPRELEVLICGRREVDVDLLRQCTEYSEGAEEAMVHVQHFWEVLKEMSSEDRTSFLRFVWARSRMPNSAKDFPMNFKIQSAHDPGARVDPDAYLPHAQTCFFALRLPTYSSKEILRAKLLYAIQNSPNMDADVRLHNAEGWADA